MDKINNSVNSRKPHPEKLKQREGIQTGSSINRAFSNIKKLFTSRKRLTVLFILILIVGFAFWRFLGSKKQQPQYQTATVDRGTIISSVSASGQILSTNIVNITTGASGTVKDVLVKDGDKLNVGDKIADVTLDSQGQQQNAQSWSSYLAAKDNLDSANYTAYSLQSDMFTKWKTFMDLATNSTYQNADGSPNTSNRTLPEFIEAQDNWLAAEAKYKTQQAVITQAQAAMSSSWLSYNLTSPTITTPIAGTVENLTIVPGLVLSNQSTTSVGTGGSSQSNLGNQKVAVIQNEGMPIATFNLSEVDITKIKADQNVTITLDAIPGKTFAGKVASVDHIGTVTSGVTNYQVLVSFESNVPEILPNMSTTANIIVETKDNVLKVPTTAIQTSNGQTSVRVMNNGQVASVPVETGIASDSETEIISGLSEGQTVVTSVIQPSTSGGSTSPFGSLGGRGGVGGAARIGGGGR